MEQQEKKATLDDLLKLQEYIDAGIIVLAKDEFEATEEALRSKVDDAYGFMLTCEGRSEALKKQAKMLMEQAKACENAKENLKNRYKDIAHYYGHSEILGNTWKFSFSETESLEVDVPDKELSVEHKRDHYDFIEEINTYKWNKTAVKKAIKSGSQFEIARLKKGIKMVINPIPVSKKKGK